MTDLNELADRVITSDVLIIGSEAAGARAAIEIKKRGLSLAVVTKGYLAKSGATITADGDVDLDSKSAIERLGLEGDPRDNPDVFFEDMVKESKFISDQRLVEIHTREAPDRLEDLVRFGVQIPFIIHAPGHTYPRGAWIPGIPFARALGNELQKYDIKVTEHLMATRLLTRNGAVVGATGLKLDTGEFYVFRAKAVILCTGGALRIYPHTTAPDDLTGDGQAMAYLAGAEMIDMEFPMFLPYALIHPPAMDGIDYPFIMMNRLRCHALNARGDRYMEKWDPVRMERTTRDINSIAAAIEVLEGRGSKLGGTYVSVKHLPRRLVDHCSEWFPPEYRNWRYGEFDVEKMIPDFREAGFETFPACHFQNGGIHITPGGASTVRGLFAGGEGVGSLMGANRISGNAMTMTQVWGYRAGVSASEFAAGNPLLDPDLAQVAGERERVYAPLARDRGADAVEVKKAIQELAKAKVGVVRDGPRLLEALKTLEEIHERAASVACQNRDRTYNREWMDALQVRNMAICLEMIARASLLRTESRGALYRLDYRKTDNVNWLKNILVRRTDRGMELDTQPSVLTRLKPKLGVFDYGPMEVDRDGR
jgi:succinate dehydrogenase/fumarate reductase flavoprotein subunit